MRFLFRVVLLALAAVGAKALYDRFRPAAEGATAGGATALEPAKSAIREVADHAKIAAGEVAQHAKSAASDAASQTRDQLRESTRDTPDASTASAEG